jgi:hypothetical protein
MPIVSVRATRHGLTPSLREVNPAQPPANHPARAGGLLWGAGMFQPAPIHRTEAARGVLASALTSRSSPVTITAPWRTARAR